MTSTGHHPTGDRFDDHDHDAALRWAAAAFHAGGRPAGPRWDAVGRRVLVLAERDAWSWHGHQVEFQDGYIDGAFSYLHRHPRRLLTVQNPWGLLVVKARRAGEWAALSEATCGLVDRDPVGHRVRFSQAPKIVSLEVLSIAEGSPDDAGQR